jgi:CheY-like chemotaxis protein
MPITDAPSSAGLVQSRLEGQVLEGIFLLIDLEMPDTDGRALATEIRQGDGINSASMLILISAAENMAAGQCWSFCSFLQKPIDCQALARLIGS